MPYYKDKDFKQLFCLSRTTVEELLLEISLTGLFLFFGFDFVSLEDGIFFLMLVLNLRFFASPFSVVSLKLKEQRDSVIIFSRENIVISIPFLIF